MCPSHVTITNLDCGTQVSPYRTMLDRTMLSMSEGNEVYHAHTWASRWSSTTIIVPLDRESAYLFRMYYYHEGILVLLIVTSLDVTHFNFANAYKITTLIKMETLPLVWVGSWS